MRVAVENGHLQYIVKQIECKGKLCHPRAICCAVRPTAICCVDFDVNYSKKGKETLFSMACASGHAHIVRYLVTEAGANTAGRCASRWDHGCCTGALVL